MEKKTLLLTRSKIENNILAHDSRIAKRFKFVPCDLISYNQLFSDTQIFDLLIKNKNIIITSKYVASQIMPMLDDNNLKINIYVVGSVSAQILKQKNYIIKYVSDNAEDLNRFVSTQNNKDKFVYFAGNNITTELDNEIKKIIIYQIEYRFEIDQMTIEYIRSGIDYVMLYSTRTAEQFIYLIKKYNLAGYFHNSKLIAMNQNIVNLVDEIFNDSNVTVTKTSNKMVDCLIDDLI